MNKVSILQWKLIIWILVALFVGYKIGKVNGRKDDDFSFHSAQNTDSATEKESELKNNSDTAADLK